MEIQHVKYHQIDKRKWDDCIIHSANSLIYARSFYLDAVCEQWDALIMGEYEAVMPLTWKKKRGISYLYQPPFLQQCGIFFLLPLSHEQLQSFIDKAYELFSFAEVTFNYANNISASHIFSVTSRVNHILILNENYELISARYESIAVKNIKRANNARLTYAVSEDHKEMLLQYEFHYAKRLPSFSEKDFMNLGKICDHLFLQHDLVIRKVINESGELLAGVVLLKDNKRLYNVISFITTNGKLAQANYFLYDRLIKEFCQSDLLLDFEGSDVKGIAEFYARFGPTKEFYPFLKFNRLPWPLKILKQ